MSNRTCELRGDRTGELHGNRTGELRGHRRLKSRYGNWSDGKWRRSCRLSICRGGSDRDLCGSDGGLQRLGGNGDLRAEERVGADWRLSGDGGDLGRGDGVKGPGDRVRGPGDEGCCCCRDILQVQMNDIQRSECTIIIL